MNIENKCRIFYEALAAVTALFYFQISLLLMLFHFSIYISTISRQFKCCNIIFYIFLINYIFYKSKLDCWKYFIDQVFIRMNAHDCHHLYFNFCYIYYWIHLRICHLYSAKFSKKEIAWCAKFPLKKDVSFYRNKIFLCIPVRGQFVKYNFSNLIFHFLNFLFYCLYYQKFCFGIQKSNMTSFV